MNLVSRDNMPRRFRTLVLCRYKRVILLSNNRRIWTVKDDSQPEVHKEEERNVPLIAIARLREILQYLEAAY